MELINVLEKFVNLYENNQIPNYITILSTMIPIILSIVVIVQNHIISKRNEILQERIANDNEKLQKDIYNNEIKIKTYDVILKAYTIFHNAWSKLPNSEIALSFLLENGKNNQKLIIDMIEERDKINLEFNKLKLLLKEDNVLIEKITKLKEIYVYIVDEISQGAVTNKVIDNKKVLEEIKKYKELLGYDNFDKYFEQYLSFKEM